MKKLLLQFAGIFLLVGLQLNTNAQTLNFSAYTSSCFTNPTVNINLNVTSVPPTATNFTWTANGPCVNNVILVANGSSGIVPVSCCGMYTLVCTATDNTITPGFPVLVGSPVTQTVIVNCSPTVVATSGSACVGASAVLTASGASTYTWSNFATGSSLTVTPTSSQCYTVYGSGANGCISPAVACASIVAGPTLTVVGMNTIVCAGNTASLFVGGANTYTWSTASTGTTIAITPTATTCYSVVGQGLNGCTGLAVYCITVNPIPTISVNSSTICQGSSATLSAMGNAFSYTWIPTFFIGSNVIVSPTSSTCYTAIGLNAWNCTNTASGCVSVTPLPTVTIAGNNVLCLGQSSTLIATGANSYTWSTGTQPNSSINVSPASSTCYYVIGTNGNCIDSASFCITVNPAPPLNVTGPSSVCLGTSATYTASGANSYTWMPGATNTTTYNTMPTLAWTMYTLTGTGANGCTGIYTVSAFADSTCSDVWPGDANSDGVVNNSDVLELGLAFSSTGAARSPGGNAYNAQFAAAWLGTISTGKNKNHADCNGDGVVNNNDTLAIFINYTLTHAFKPGSPASSSDISLSPAVGSFVAGDWNKVDVMLGSTSAPMSALYGVAFDLNFDQSLVVPGSAYLKYTPSFLNANTQNVQFRKPDISNGKIYAASVRVDANNVNGSGKIAEFYYKAIDQVQNGAQMNITVSNATSIDNTGLNIGLTGGAGTFNLETNPTGISTVSAFLASISMFPNPAKDVFTIYTGTKNAVQYTVSDLSGRNVLEGSVVESQDVDTHTLQSGVYIITLSVSGQTENKKLIIE